MEIRFSADFERKLSELAAATNRSPSDLLEDAFTGYAVEWAATRAMLDQRYDDMQSGRVEAIDGEAFFEDLRIREDELAQATTLQSATS